MTIPVTFIPVAFSALRSIVHLRGRIAEVRDLARADDPLPLLLPPLPHNLIRNQTKDAARMQAAFAQDPVYRDALDVRGLLGQFDQFHQNIDPQTGATLTTERHSTLFWSFLGLYYKILDQQKGHPPEDVEDDDMGIDRFLVRSAQDSGGRQGVKILRSVAETLVEFLGDNASVFLARSSNKLILSTVLREFAANTDLEQDRPKRILKVLIGSVAVAAADHGQDATDNPAASMLFASLGQVRQEMGDDFIARIVSHEGFTAVVSDWVKDLASDPYLVELLADMKGLDDGSYDPADPTTLPPRLQPVLGALQSTLKVIGDNVGTGKPLETETIFRDVFGAVLTNLSARTAAFLHDEFDGDKFVAGLLEAVIATIGRTDPVRNNTLIAPIFAELTETMARVVPQLGQTEALSRAEEILQDLAGHITSDGVQATLTKLRAYGGEQFAQDILTELFAKARARADLALAGEGEKKQAIAALLFDQVPGLLDHGLDRDGALRLVEQIIAEVLPDDTPEGAFVLTVLPHLDDILGRIRAGRPALDSATLQSALDLLIKRVTRDSPVWQALHENGQASALLDVIGDVLSGDEVPKRLPLPVVMDMMETVLGALSRNGAKLSKLAQVAQDPEAHIRAEVSAILTQAVTEATARLGHAAGADDMALIVRAILTHALSKDAPGVLSAAELASTVTAALERAH